MIYIIITKIVIKMKMKMMMSNYNLVKIIKKMVVNMKNIRK